MFVYGWLLYQEGLLQGPEAVSYTLRLPFILVITLFLGYIVDLQTKDRDRQLKASEARYRSFIENLPVGSYQRTTGENSRFLMMNRAFLRMFGFKGKPDAWQPAALPYADADQEKEIVATLEAKGNVDGLAVDLRRKNGTVLTPVSGHGATGSTPGRSWRALLLMKPACDRPRRPCGRARSGSRWR